MKLKYLGFIGIALTSVSLASCNFIDILSKKVKSLSISDNGAAYVIGDTYNFSSLTIDATYSDNHHEKLTKNDVSFNLSLNGHSYNIASPFEVAGEYNLTATKDGVNSNTITVSVYASTQYVSDIAISGSHEVEEKKTITLTLTITPTKYTVPIEYQVGDSSIVEVNKLTNESYRVKGLVQGSTTITFKARSSETEYCQNVFNITVNESTRTEIKQLYKDYVANYAYNTSVCPSVGTNVKLLVIPVWFSDSSNYVSASNKNMMKDDIQTVFFGSKADTGWHSVSSYYEEESGGELHLTGTVSDWYSPSTSATTVSGYSTNQQANFVKNATNWYFTNHSSDSRKNYDYDGDGYLDGVMFIYAAPDYRIYSSFTSNMWAYCFFVQDTGQKNYNNPGINAFFWASYDFIYGSDNAKTRTGSTYHHGDTAHCNLDGHTYIHEMGHMFGLEDYYDYSTDAYAKSPAAGFSMQDHNVGGHDPFSTMSLGWSNPYIPTSTQQVTINDFQSSRDLILLTPEWNSSDSPFDEYLLIELYTPTGLNKFDSDYRYQGNYPLGPASAGIRLWHVDARLFAAYDKIFFSNVNDYNYKSTFATAFNNTYCYTGEDSSDPDAGRSAFAYEYGTGGTKVAYQRTNMLQLIRSNSSTSYYAKDNLTYNDLFYKDYSFDMNTYSGQFYYNNGKLNNGKNLGWSFTINSITTNPDGSSSATISLVKA